ncbi:MAG TPA: hypothetical protein VF635_16955 [Propionibacteriaceae bacterium]|jgi:hypothetical protein
MEWSRLVDEIIQDTGITPYGDQAGLGVLLGIEGAQKVAWLLGKSARQPLGALSKVAGAYEWVTVQDLAVALGRTRAGAPAQAHNWPPTVPALLAWLPTLPGWSVQARANVWCAVPVGEPPSLTKRDAALCNALRAGAKDRGDLLDALTRVGYARATASVHVSSSPLIVRGRDARPLAGRLRDSTRALRIDHCG